MRYLITLGLLWSMGFAHAADWELAKDKNGITIETREVAGTGLKEFKAQMTVKARLNSVLALLYDLESAPQWIHDNKEQSLDEEITEQERWLYLVNGAPWPLKTRDAYLHVITSQDPGSKVVELTISADPDRKPKSNALVRIPAMSGGWRFVPLADGHVEVNYALFVDPGGRVPKALVNAVVVDNPYGTLMGMQKMLKSGAYDDASRAWITEP